MPAKDAQCLTCPLAEYQPALAQTHDEPDASAGWICEVTREFVTEAEAPLVGCCDYLKGYQAASAHPLDALKRESDLGDQMAIDYLAEYVPSHILEAALATAPESALSRAARLHRAESESEHTARTGALENG